MPTIAPPGSVWGERSGCCPRHNCSDRCACGKAERMGPCNVEMLPSNAGNTRDAAARSTPASYRKL
eukprot:14593202-Heterocapsa_arctica.AAC.1